MISNREMSRLFALYAELLLLHKKDERLAALLSGASYRLRNLTENVTGLSKEELLRLFRPEITATIIDLKNTAAIEALDELIQLTPQGLFEMMRIKGLGGKKLAVLWKTAGIDSIESLLKACKNDEVSKIPGFGKKTQQNIIKSIEDYHSRENRFHYASVADIANSLVHKLQKLFKTKLISLCGEVRRQNTTVACIEIITTVPSKDFDNSAVRKLIVIESSQEEQIKAHTFEEIPVTIYHTTKKSYYYGLFIRSGNDDHVKKVQKKNRLSRPLHVGRSHLHKCKTSFYSS